MKIETNKNKKKLIFEVKDKDKDAAFFSCLYRLIKDLDKSIPYVELGYEPLDEDDLI